MIRNETKHRYRFLECRPDRYQTWYDQGNLLREQAFYDDALFCYDKALSYYQNNYFLWYYRAKVLEELHNFTEALSSLEVACQIHADNYWAWYDRGFILQEEFQDVKNAIICFENALNYKPNDYWATYRLAKCYLSKKKYLSALHLFQKTKAIRPDDYWSYYWQGECQRILKQWYAAQKSYESALQIKPNDYWALRQLAFLKERQCLYDEAIAYYEQLLGILGADSEIYQHMITCYQILGNRQQANFFQEQLTQNSLPEQKKSP